MPEATQLVQSRADGGAVIRPNRQATMVPVSGDCTTRDSTAPEGQAHKRSGGGGKTPAPKTQTNARGPASGAAGPRYWSGVWSSPPSAAHAAVPEAGPAPRRTLPNRWQGRPQDLRLRFCQCRDIPTPPHQEKQVTPFSKTSKTGSPQTGSDDTPVPKPVPMP